MFTNINTVPTNAAGYPYVSLAPNQNYQLSLLVSDPDVSDVVVMEALVSQLLTMELTLATRTLATEMKLKVFLIKLMQA